MLKPYNRNPLTIHIASHTGSEVRGEGKLISGLSGQRSCPSMWAVDDHICPSLHSCNAPSFRRRRVIPDLPVRRRRISRRRCRRGRPMCRSCNTILRHPTATADLLTESLAAICVAPSKLLFCRKRILGVYSEPVLCPATAGRRMGLFSIPDNIYEDMQNSIFCRPITCAIDQNNTRISFRLAGRTP